jgi:pilus assembly protein TadC
MLQRPGAGVMHTGPSAAAARHRVTALGDRRRLPWVAAVLALPAAWAATGVLVPGVVAAALAAGAVVLAQRRRPAAGFDGRAVALTLDLVAAALRAGAPADQAIALVAGALAELPGRAAEYGRPGVLSAVAPAARADRERLEQAIAPLARVGRLLQLGADPYPTWTELAEVTGYRGVAVAARRCADSGARLAQALTTSAQDLRSEHRVAAIARAERTGVWVLLPLGVCFLPAFVCIGVVPIVIGVAGQVLHG